MLTVEPSVRAKLAGRPAVASPASPSIWGLDPVTLHDRFWASRGVCVVRSGEASVLPQGADLFMLTDDRTLTLFSLRDAATRLFWVRPDVLFVRFKDQSQNAYREFIRHDEADRFVGFERQYGRTSHCRTRVALTRSRRVAESWQTAWATRDVWRAFRTQCKSIRQEAFVTDGCCYARLDAAEVDRMVRDLTSRWKDPGSTIEGVYALGDGVWAGSPDARPAGNRSVHAPVWVGAGRQLPAVGSVVGPAVLWDLPQHKPVVNAFRWADPAPAGPPPVTAERWARVKQGRDARRPVQRLFDLVVATLLLLLVLPLFPLVMLAIWLDDGRPFFFTHRRETTGGREFACLKFRTMCRNATEMRSSLAPSNESDGPQFFIRNDPRVTRVGRFLRATYLDETPQLLNVLCGQMSIVGPRPSPRAENQFCPAWREARLSVRPGITGLWQVSRTRSVGRDFQEWIRFDVDYVEHASLLLDIKIVLKTARVLVKG